MYPDAARKVNASGTTELSFKIEPDGSVKDVAVTNSSGNADLDWAAVTCVSGWRYKPAIKDGSPAESPWTSKVTWMAPHPATPAATPAVVGLQKQPPTVAEDIASVCAHRRPSTAALPPPDQPGITSVSYRVMPDGRITDVKLARSSGESALDDILVRCVTGAEHFDVSIFTFPPEGIMGHIDVDWRREALNSPPGLPSR
jgi:TonB family protein